VKLARRRHKHVGAPDNRIKSRWIENVLTPQGKDMILELGPMVTAPPQITYNIFTPSAIHFIQFLVKIEDNLPVAHPEINSC